MSRWEVANSDEQLWEYWGWIVEYTVIHLVISSNV
jgi:hypothetical protein